MQICFCTTYIGEPDKINIPVITNIVPNADYYLFTNLSVEHVHKNHPYTIIQITPERFPDIASLPNNVKVSRYFKFQLHKALSIIGKTYDFIYYYDHFYQPKMNVNYSIIYNKCVELTQHESLPKQLAIVQKPHTSCSTIASEMDLIVTCKKESLDNIQSTKQYLFEINPDISLSSKIQFAENCVFGFSPKHKLTTDFYDLFWKHYTNPKYTTYRDQPLWNFLYQHTQHGFYQLPLEQTIYGRPRHLFDMNRCNSIFTQSS